MTLELDGLTRRFGAVTALDGLPSVALAVFLGYVVTACFAAGVHLTRGDV